MEKQAEITKEKSEAKEPTNIFDEIRFEFFCVFFTKRKNFFNFFASNHNRSAF